MKDLKKVIVDSDKNEIREVFYMCHCDIKKSLAILEEEGKDNKKIQDALWILRILDSIADEKVICFV